MKRTLALVLCGASFTTLMIDIAEARRGRFLSGYAARGVARGGSSGIKAYGPDTLTVEQLTECLKRADALDRESDDLELARVRFEEKSSGVDRLKSEIELERSALNQRSQKAVDQFNQKVARYNKLTSEARTEQTSFNQGVGAHNANVNGYNASCSKRYYDDDLNVARLRANL